MKYFTTDTKKWHTLTQFRLFTINFNQKLLLQIVFSRIKKKKQLIINDYPKKLEQHTFNRNILIIEVVYFLGRTVFIVFSYLLQTSSKSLFGMVHISKPKVR